MLRRPLASRLSVLCLAHALGAQTHTSGDMVGSLRPDAAIVWTRASASALVSVVYAKSASLAGALATPQVATTVADDHTCKIPLSGLTASTDYWYATRLEDPTNSTIWTLGPTGHFKTPPLPASDVACSLAFSGDVLNPAETALFAQIQAQGHDLYLSLGDYTYCDPSTTVAEFRSKHAGIRMDPYVQAFFRSLGCECIWDDHEVENDWHGGTDPTKVKNGKAVWFEWFPMPPAATEIYRSVRWGKGVEVFLLDCRSKRGNASDPDVPAKSMLGAAQRQWLETALLASDATFKVIVSSMPLRYGHGITDSWWYSQQERQRIFGFLNANKIANVVFLTADNHFFALHEHREGFREYMVGPIAQSIGAPLPNLDPEARVRRPERNWGVLRYDPAARALTVEAHGTSGPIHKSVLPAARPGTLRIQADRPEAAWTSAGPFFLRNSGLDVTAPRVEPGSYPIAFAALPRSAGQPVPIAVDVPAGGEVRVACSYRDDPSPNPVLFADAFEKDTSAFTIVDTATNLPSAWYVDNGYLYQASNLSDGNPVSLAGTEAVFGSSGWTDCTVSFRARSFDDDVFGLMFRYVDRANHYRLAFDRERPGVTLLKCKGGVLTELAREPWAYEPHTWYDVRVAAAGGRLRVAVGGAVTMEADDPDFPAGKCALFTGSNLLTSFDDLVVRAGDTLAWSQDWLLRDDFGGGSLAAWTVLDEGTVSAPSAWSVTDGACTQGSNIHTPETSAADIVRRGTMLLRGNAAWTDYRVAATLRNDDDDGMGLVFRYTGRNDYYRFSWDSERKLRMLTRVKGGAWAVLQQDAVPYAVGRSYRISCEVAGTRIRVLIDGALWADVDDRAGLPAGLVGVYCWRSDALACDDVEVVANAPLRPVLAATLGSPVRLAASCPSGAGLPYLLALSRGRSPGIPLAQLVPSDPRIWPLAADGLFFTSLAPSPVLSGFRGRVAASGEITATLHVPVLPGLTGTPFFAGGIVLDASSTRVVEILPSVELAFP